MGSSQGRKRALDTVGAVLMQWAMRKDQEKQALANKIAQEDAAKEKIKLMLEKRKLDQEWDIKKMELQVKKEKEMADYRDSISDQNTAEANTRADALAQQKAISEERKATQERRQALADEKRKAKNKTPEYIKVKVGDKLLWGQKTPQGIVLTDKEADKGGVNIDIQESREERAKKDQEMQEQTFEQKQLAQLAKEEELILGNKQDPAVLPHIDIFQKMAKDKPYTYIFEKKPKTIFGMNAGFTQGAKKIDLPKKKDGTQILAGDVWDTLEMNRGKQFLLPGSTKPIVINTYEDVLRYIGAYE